MGIVKKNNSPRLPLHYLIGNDRVVAQFYNSWDKKYHLSELKLLRAGPDPLYEPPREYLCKASGNQGISSREEGSRNICSDCWQLLIESL